MTNILMIKLLDKYSVLFNSKGKTVLEWSKIERKLIYKIKFQDQIVWYFNVFIVLFGSQCCTFLALRPIFAKENFIPLWIVILQGFISLGGWITLLQVLIYIGYGRTLARDINAVLGMARVLLNGE